MTALTTASPSPRFSRVSVAGREVLAVRDGDQVRVPMKPLCGTLGIDWPPQARRIQRDAVLAEGVTMMVIPSAGGNQEQITLPLGLLPGFLFGLEPRRFAPELQEVIHAFRRECFDVLYRHFYRSSAPLAISPAKPTAQELQTARISATALVAAIAAETSAPVRAFLHQLLRADADRLGLAAPALGDLGQGRTPEARIDAVLEACRTLTARRVKWNHLNPRGAGGGANIAICLPELARLFATNDIDLGADADLDAVFAGPTTRHRIHRRTIDSAFARRAVHCVLVEAWS